MTAGVASTAPLERARALLLPLADPLPFGVDARQDPEHDGVRTEIAKLDSPGAAPIDWARVERAGSTLLATRSKDLLIAAYTAHAWLRLDGLAGLHAGVVLLTGLCDGAWEGMFPPPARAKARAAALEWFVERSAVALRAAPPVADAAALTAVEAALAQLAAVSERRLGELAPKLASLVAALAAVADASAAGVAADGTASAAGAASEAAANTAEITGAPSNDAADPQAGGAGPAEDPLQLAREQLARATEGWLRPISADAPSGKDARYDPLHEYVRGQIKQLDAPTGHAIEWKKLLAACATLLEERSKDLLIASYAAHALHREAGLAGLAEGLALLAQLLEQRWDDLYPDMKRNQKARAAALSWLLARETTFAEAGLGAATAADVVRLEAAARWLAELIALRFDDEHRPAVRPLLDQVEQLKLDASPRPAPLPAVPARAPQPAETAAVARQAAEVSVPQAPVAPGPSANRAELSRYLTGVHVALADLGRALRKQNDKDVLAYLLPRLGAALKLDEVPPSNAGRTFVSAPDRGEVEEIRGLLREQRWPELLQAAEACAANNPLFLDMQRLSHAALQGLGDAYAPCRLVVEAELASLLRRMPELSELAFQDGTPFADADTRAFLRAEILASGAGSARGAEPGDAEPEDAEALSAARALAVSGKKLEALAAFEALLQRAASGRSRFRIRLGLASAMLAAGDPLLASGLFGTLYHDIDRLGLDDWEPGLAAECLADYHACLSRLGPSTEMAQHRAVVYARLCRVDPRRALETNP